MEVNPSEHIVALCSSKRNGSHTRQALSRALTAAEGRDVTTHLGEAAELDFPLLDPDHGDAGDATELRRRVVSRNGDCLCHPEG